MNQINLLSPCCYSKFKSCTIITVTVKTYTNHITDGFIPDPC